MKPALPVSTTQKSVTVDELSTATQTKIAGGRPRILFVDDDEGLHQLVSEMFHRQDVPFDYHFVTTGGGACSMMNLYCYDAVILDYKLPDFTGATIGPKIREKSPDIPMAYLTDYSSEEVTKLAKAINAEYWPKLETVNDDGGAGLVRSILRLIKEKRCPNNERRSRSGTGGLDTGERRRQTDKPLSLSPRMMMSVQTPLRGRRAAAGSNQQRRFA